MRAAYNKIQKGMKANSNLSQDRIERLEEIGFKWKLIQDKTTFEQRCHDLEAFKSEFGHCNVPQPYSVDPSFEKWFQSNSTRKSNEPESLSRLDRVSRNDWFQMETQMMYAGFRILYP